MIQIKEIKGEDRKRYLARLAVAMLGRNAGYGIEEEIHYDEANCDINSLADDLKIEFEIKDDEVETLNSSIKL